MLTHRKLFYFGKQLSGHDAGVVIDYADTVLAHDNDNADTFGKTLKAFHRF